MVAKITTPNSISKALNYNEKKVQKGVAQCIHAGNFLKNAKELNFYEKLHHFKRYIDLNTRAKTNTLHISLNFDPAEKLGPGKLVQIATTYMDKIGFGGQPYLVYEHHDAGHPHLHIVTTSIEENGRRIVTQNIGRNQSQKARKEIEEAFGLVKATSKKRADAMVVTNQKIQYGKNDTKRSITGVLHTVFSRYHFTSLPELNAILKLYNLHADRGEKDSRIFQNGGLVYRVLDDKGNKVGVPIKASSIRFKPTLPYLETQFKKGEEARAPHKQRLKTAIEFVLHQKPQSLTELVAGLKDEKITTALRENAAGFVYGITFIDHRTGAVFNGSDLGKGYSAAALQERIKDKAATLGQPEKLVTKSPQKNITRSSDKDISKSKNTTPSQPLADLLKTEKDEGRIPYEFRKKKKKKRGFNL
ncbi:MAG TPA: relaxase/mobilization nuclease domain-containing protein [Flavisolibacter sp.]|nr:relaxase/mobilization nuclease domain-containing protein [Flavisolibacter sp.]